jgi:FkbM family methyltransferase
MDGGEKYRRFYAMSQIRQIQGTCFCVPSNMIDDLRVDFFHCVDACLDNKYIGSDEKIFDFAYLRNPKNYNLINCSWREYFDLLNPNTSECSKESPGVFEKAPGNGSSSGKNILIDLGSHRGEGLREILTNHLSIDADWEIHAFEPNPLIDPREYLDTLDCDVTFYRSAAWINDGSIEFDLYGEDGVSQGALIRETGGGKEYADFHGASFVECINFLDFLSQFDDSDNLFIKMDIEWSEYAILDKMLEAGWPYNIKKLWVEFHGKHQSEMQSKIHNLSNRIKDKGVVLEEWD